MCSFNTEEPANLVIEAEAEVEAEMSGAEAEVAKAVVTGK